LIPLSLGGSNSIRNLWPNQPKFTLELLCERCSREETPQARTRRTIGSEIAQREIAFDWIEAYKKYVRETLPMPVVRKRLTIPHLFVGGHFCCTVGMTENQEVSGRKRRSSEEIKRQKTAFSA